MAKICVLSDIHGNLAAFEAVLARLDELGVDTIYSLGDTVGYGPQPVECMQLARKRCAVMLMGNHEFAAYNGGCDYFNPTAARAIAWTRKQLQLADELDQLQDLPASFREGAVLYAHGSAHDPIHDYVLEQDSQGYSFFDTMVQQLDRDFTDFDLCFVGHNHKPFLCTQEGFIHPHDNVSKFHVTGQKLYVCVGSVGQPRDADPRACFVIYDGASVTYHRVSYPVLTTMDKIIEVGLPEKLAKRLAVGR